MKYFTTDNLDSFKSLVRACGDFMIKATVEENNTENVKQKAGDADFVTIYDEGVQHLLVDGILEIFCRRKGKFRRRHKIRQMLCYRPH